MKLLAAPKGGRKRPILVVLAVLTIGLTLFGPDEPSDSAADPQYTVRASTSKAAGPALSRRTLEFPERSAKDLEILNVFAGHSWYVPPPPAPVVYMAPAKPVAPPLPYTFLGSFVEAGGKPVYYLTRGDRAYDVRVGETLDGTYSLDAEDNGHLMLTYLPLKERQTLSVGR